MANYKAGSIGTVIHGNGFGTSTTLTPGASAVAGERVIVALGSYDNNANFPTLSVSDSLNGSYGQDSSTVQFNDGGFRSGIAIFSVNVTSAGTPTVTVSNTGQGASPAFVAVAWIAQNTPTSSPVDVHKEATGTGGTASSTATTNTTGSNEYAVGMYYDDGWNITLSGNQGAGWTQRATNGPDNTIELLVEDQGSIASGTAITANLASGTPGGTTATWAMLCVVYKDRASGPPPDNPRRHDPWASARMWAAYR